MYLKYIGKDRRVIFSSLWVFYLVNILYADVLSIMGESAAVKTAEEVALIDTLVSPEMLLVSAIFLEMAMLMILFSWLLKYRFIRWANMGVAALHFLGLIASLFVGTPTIFYLFFALVELLTLAFIFWYAWVWKPLDEEK